MTWTRSERCYAWLWSRTKNLRRGIALPGLVLGYYCTPLRKPLRTPA